MPLNEKAFILTFNTSSTSQIKEHHTNQYQEQIESLALQVLFPEHHCPEKERNNHTTPTHHRNDGNHRIVQAQGIEIYEISSREEDGDEYNRPTPMERRSLLTLGIPQQEQHRSHHEALVNVVPRLDRHPVKTDASFSDRSHQILVVQTTDRTQYRSPNDGKHPSVMLEVNAFLLSASTQQEERENGEQHPNPLIEIEPFAKDEHGTDQHHHRTSGIDGTYQCNRQMLDAKVSQNPRGQHNA